MAYPVQHPCMDGVRPHHNAMLTLWQSATRHDLAPPIRDGDSALREMGDWLGGFRWDHWGTFTFDARFGPTGPSEDRAMYHWRRFVESTLPRSGYFAAVECGRLGRVHLHALLRSSEAGGFGITGSSMWRSWFQRYGRNHIAKYDPERGACHYITKYLTKAPLHWDLERPIVL